MKKLYFCKMKRYTFYILSMIVVLFFTSCRFQKTLKNSTLDEKYKLAIELYNKKDYNRALQLFDQMMGAVRATDKAEDVYYFYAYCYYYQKDFTMGSYYFKRFYSNFPTSARAEEAMFMSAYCNYQNSPLYSLDQTSTYDAIKELQLFVNQYPKSLRIPECNDLIDKLRAKLELKDYKVAKLYYRMGDFAAAAVSLNNILKDYPETPHKEEIMFEILKVYQRYAKESIPSKQIERYTKAVNAYKDLVREYPESQYKSEADDLYAKSVTELDLLKAKQ
jgi:outer membrane protein assembly factor BamD